MKKTINFILIIMVIIMIVISANTTTLAVTQESIITLNISVKYGQTEARSMLGMINKFRTGKDAWYWNSDNSTKIKCDLEDLTYDYNLEKIAMQRAAEIALSFGHTRPNGESCFSIYVDGYSSYGENIAAGYTTAKSAFVAWQETNYGYSGQGHRRNMLASSYTAIGIGHVYYNGVHYWVQEFGIKNTNTTSTAVNNKTKNVSVDILSSSISSFTLSPSVTSFKINCNSTKSLPAVKVYATIMDSWPYYNCPINVSYAWSVSNTSYAKISNNKIKGLKVGKTNLVTTVLGKKIIIPVTVIPSKITELTTKGQYTTSIKLSWTKITNATGYKVYKYNTKTKKYVKVTTTKNNSYTVKKLTAGTSYKFKVVAYQTISGKTYEGSYSSVLTTATKPKKTQISKITSQNKKTTIYWKKISGASGYEIYMATNKNKEYTKIKNITKASTVKYTKSSLKKNKKYYFKVRSYKTVKNKKVYSSYSTIKSIKVK